MICDLGSVNKTNRSISQWRHCTFSELFSVATRGLWCGFILLQVLFEGGQMPAASVVAEKCKAWRLERLEAAKLAEEGPNRDYHMSTSFIKQIVAWQRSKP